MKKRNTYCDALRFIAIVSVVAIHVFADFRDTYLHNNRLYYGILTFFDSITRTGVPLFFMMTGIFMLNSNKEKTLSEFYKKRLPKLIIPFILFSVIYYVFEQYKISQNISLIRFIIKFTNNQIKYHLWFMYPMIIIYLFIPFLRKFIKNLNRKYLKTLIGIIFILGNVFLTINICSIKLNHTILSSLVLPNMSIYMNYLFLGYYLNKYNIKKKERKIIYILGIISTLLMPIVDNYFISEKGRDDFFLNSTSLFPVMQSAAISLLFKYNYEKLKIKDSLNLFFQKTANIAFYIYLSHVLVMEILKICIIKRSFFKNNLPSLTIYNIIIFILTFLISYIVSIYFEKIYNYITNKMKKQINQ